MSVTSGGHLVAHTDGAARGNPGPAGIGVVITDARGIRVATLARYIGKTTNNQAEYAALLAALEIAVERYPRHLDLYLDSELVVRQLQGLYRVRHPHLVPLYERSKSLLRRFSSYTIQHVPRSANREADALANKAIDDQACSRVDNG